VTGDAAAALSRATVLRHTLRALLEAEPIPRRALQTADRLIGDEFAGLSPSTVVAVHDRRTGTLSYACADHAPPVVLGPAEHVPVVTGEVAPIGSGRAGMRQTTFTFPTGSLACVVGDGRDPEDLLGHEQAIELIETLGPLPTARRVRDAVADGEEVTVCLLRPAGAKAGSSRRVEELELTADDIDAGRAAHFLRCCGVGEFTVARYDSIARRAVQRCGGAQGIVVRVLASAQPRVEIVFASRPWPQAPAPAALAV
jgi:hypothetical protein